MLDWFYKWRLWRYSFVWEKFCLNRTGPAQAPPLRSIGKAATSVLPPFTPLYFSFQNKCTSYAGRSGRASVRSLRSLSPCWFSSSSRRLAISLCPLSGHLILSKTAPSVCLLKNENALMKSFGQIDFVQNKNAIFQKSAQTAFKSLRLLRRRFCLKSSRRSAPRADFQNCGGSARSGQKKTSKKFYFDQ